jgi:glutamate synthase domain-containing protein 2
MKRASRAAAAGLTALAAVAARDLVQREHTLLRNFPVLGHARYLLEALGPELRQYLVAGDNEERPFTRDQRRWVYASAKRENNYFGFGTDNDLEYTAGHPVINHRTFGRAVPPSHVEAGQDVGLPCAKVLGAARGRRAAFRPTSVVNISAMSFVRGSTRSSRGGTCRTEWCSSAPASSACPTTRSSPSPWAATW